MNRLPDFLGFTSSPASSAGASKFPRLRFTLRGMMIAVSLVAFYCIFVRFVMLGDAVLFQGCGPTALNPCPTTNSIR